MKKILYKVTTAFAATLVLTASLEAAMMISQDGDNTPFADWTVAGLLASDTTTGSANAGSGETPVPDATTGGPGIDVGGQNALRITATTSDAFAPTDIIYTTAPALTGNFTSFSGIGVAFDFYAGGNGDGSGAPTDLGVYLQSGGSEVWYYSITSPIVDGWGSYGASFSSGAWYGFTDNTWGAVATDFQGALADVTALGIYITYQGDTPGQIYGIDNFGLAVPEPETYMVLGMALLTVAFVFRKRITESLAEARTMMQV